MDDAQDGDLPAGLAWPEAVNAGQALLFAGMKALGAAAPGHPVAEEIGSAGLRLAEGQAIDLGSHWDACPTEDTVMAAVRGKAGASMMLFARVSARSAGLADSAIKAWGDFGQALGMAIQLRSDLCDLDASESRDFAARKATLPIAYVRNRHEAEFLSSLQGGGLPALRKLLKESGAWTLVAFKIEALIDEALEAVDRLALSPPSREAAELLIRQATARAVAI